MKRLLFLIGLVLASPILAHAQGWQIPLAASTPRALNTPGTTLNRVNADLYGNALISLSSGTAAVSNPTVLEDIGLSSGQAGFTPLVKFLDTNPFDPAVSSTGDGQHILSDAEGRMAVNAYGANVAEFYSSCSSAITGTARTAIKAAVASNRIYVTSISCSNNSAVSSQASFTDGAGAQLAAGNITALGGVGFVQTFPVPLRGTVNTDFSVTLTTTATSTICCANGYIANN